MGGSIVGFRGFKSSQSVLKGSFSSLVSMH
jgi:hypothetical protein